MGHEAEDGSCLVVDAGDIAPRAVGIGLSRDLALRVAIAEGDAALTLEPRQRLVVGEIAAVLMRDGEADDLALFDSGR